MEELIKELEKKQSEIWTDIEDMESLKTLTENDIIEEKLIVQPNGRKIGF